MTQRLKPYTLGGRGRTGSDSSGAIFHAVADGSEYSHNIALCGVKPGRQSIGWSTWQPRDQAVTCPKCLKRANPFPYRILDHNLIDQAVGCESKEGAVDHILTHLAHISAPYFVADETGDLLCLVYAGAVWAPTNQ